MNTFSFKIFARLYSSTLIHIHTRTHLTFSTSYYPMDLSYFSPHTPHTTFLSTTFLPLFYPRHTHCAIPILLYKYYQFQMHDYDFIFVFLLIERVIGALKNRFHILDGPLPVQFVKSLQDEMEKKEVATIDKIVHVCAALLNMSSSVVFNHDRVGDVKSAQ